MKLLTLLARSFRWKPYAKPLAEPPNHGRGHRDRSSPDGSGNADPDNPSALRQALKHIKWLADKRCMENVVLHSFAHLGGDCAPPAQARRVLDEVARESGYQVRTAAFGYFCEWDINVYGESLAKVRKEI